MKTKLATLFGLAIAATIIGCAITNIYVTFPTGTIENAAASIEKEVASGATTVTPTPEPKATPGGQSFWRHFDFCSTACAAEIDLNVSTPAIRKIVESRTARFAKIAAYRAKGNIGEGNDAKVVLRNTDGLPLPEVAQLKALVNAENGDRKQLFNEILLANSMDPSQLDGVVKAFAKALADQAAAGTWVQDAEGKWAQKP